MDSDGEREDEDEDEDEQPSAVFQPGQRPTEEVDGPGLRNPRSRDPHSAVRQQKPSSCLSSFVVLHQRFLLSSITEKGKCK